MADMNHGIKRVVYCRACKFSKLNGQYTYRCQHPRSKGVEVSAFDWCAWAEEIMTRIPTQADKNSAKYEKIYHYVDTDRGVRFDGR